MNSNGKITYQMQYKMQNVQNEVQKENDLAISLYYILHKLHILHKIEKTRYKASYTNPNILYFFIINILYIIVNINRFYKILSQNMQNVQKPYLNKMGVFFKSFYFANFCTFCTFCYAT